MKKGKRVVAAILAMVMILGGSASYVYASSTTSTSQHKHYIPKTNSGTASDIIRNERVVLVGFKINKINNANNQSSNYQKVKMSFLQYDNNGAGMWKLGTGFSSDGFNNNITGEATKYISFTVKKEVYYEVATGLMNDQVTTCALNYYGNDPDLAAYAYMWEDWN